LRFVIVITLVTGEEVGTGMYRRFCALRTTVEEEYDAYADEESKSTDDATDDGARIVGRSSESGINIFMKGEFSWEETYPPPPLTPVKLVGYVPPAGVPAVELGLALLRQVPLLKGPELTVPRELPAVPLPLASPPTITRVVPLRRDGSHEKPVPCDGTFVIEPSGMENDSPPGITPRKLGVLVAPITLDREWNAAIYGSHTQPLWNYPTISAWAGIGRVGLEAQWKTRNLVGCCVLGRNRSYRWRR
jgi:hypothetical protein